MAKKPDGAAAGVQRVTFTKSAADRIARAVREVEGGGRDQGPMEFGMRAGAGQSQKVFRVCKYSGSWSIGSAKTVTFKNQTATPNTVSATNLFFPITNTATDDRDCAVAKEGTAWYLIDVQFYTATAVFVTTTATATHVTDISVGATLNTSSCTVSVGRTLTTASIISVTGTVTSTFLRLEP